MDNKIFNNLNKKQKEAVSFVDGPSVILAGAGSGKTRVLVYKVLSLIENHHVNPSSIVMITFTNKAATEMKERMGLRRLGYIGTFHAFCTRLLRIDGEAINIKNSFTIYDDNDSSNLITSIIKKQEMKKKHSPGFFLNRISQAKSQLVTADRYLEIFSDYSSSEVAEIYDLYQKELKKNNALDFDDLLMKAVELFTKNKEILKKYQDKYRYLLVDEFQDTNAAQYALTKLLGKKNKNITVVGDFSQSIYSWRGADVRNLEKFKEDFPEAKIFHLEENYRSTQKILDFAYEVISKNQTHPILHLFTKNDEGDEIVYYEGENEQDEALFITNEIDRMIKDEVYQSFAVLYRTNAQSRVIEEALLHYGMPYRLIGGTRFYARREIKDIISYLRLLINPIDSVSNDRIIKLGKRKWKEFQGFYSQIKDSLQNLNTTEIINKLLQETSYLKLYNPEDPEDYSRLENIKELKSVAVNFDNLGEFLEQIALVESEYFEGEKKLKGKDGVVLMTLHQAKGLEFPYVFITGVEEGILPHSRSMDNLFEIEEERRLFYVGITRARKKLYVTYTKKRFIFGRRIESIKSRFINNDDNVSGW